MLAKFESGSSSLHTLRIVISDKLENKRQIRILKADIITIIGEILLIPMV
jgi:hypothetical protein